MADILKDLTATFQAADVWADTKVNNTARADSDSNLWVTANWANAVDDQLKLTNSFFLGEETAGITGTSAQFDGGLIVAEDLSVGGSVGIGDYAIAATDVEIKTTAGGTGRVLFGKSGTPANGGLSYSHAADLLSVLAAGSSRVEVGSASLRPTAHNVTKLGDSTHRWSEVHASQAFARTGATVGGLSSAVTLKIDGGSSVAIPELVFAYAGAEQAKIDAPDTGELRVTSGGPLRLADVAGGLGLPVLTTAERTALTGFEGLAVYDSDLMDILVHNGVDWSEVGILNYGLDQTLVISNATGGTDIVISNGDAIVGADGGSVSFEPSTGTIALSSRVVVGDAGSEIEGFALAGGTITANVAVSEIGATNQSQFLIHRHSTTDSPSLSFLRSNSDTSAHAIVTDGQQLMNVCAAGWDGVDYALGGCLSFSVSGTPGADDMPTKFSVSVSADGTQSPTERFSIAPSGATTVNGNTTINGNLSFNFTHLLSSSDAYIAGGAGSPSLNNRGATGYNMPVLTFPDPTTSVRYAYWWLQMPRGFTSSWTVEATIWFAQAAAGAGDITWSLSFDRIESGILSTVNSFDTDGPVSHTSTASGVQYQIQSTTVTIPYSFMDGILGGEIMYLKIQPSTTGDTFSGDRDLLAIQFKFTPG